MASLNAMVYPLPNDAMKRGEQGVDFRFGVVMRKADAQHAALVHQPHAADGLDGVVVARPDEDIVLREALGQCLRVMAIEREGYGRHAPVHGIGRGDAADGEALERLAGRRSVAA